MNSYTGNFIVLEGIDGSGKSTVLNGLKNRFSKSKWEFTQEPSNGVYGRALRDELKSESQGTLSDLFMFYADRVDHCESLIGPRLEKGINIVSDRYYPSSYAYQTKYLQEYIGDDASNFVRELTDNFVIEPDLILIIDIDVDTAMERLNGGDEKFENRKELERAAVRYRNIAEEKDNAVLIDGDISRDVLINICQREIQYRV